MNYEIVYTENFERELKRLAKKYRSLKNDLEGLISTLEENPAQGAPVRKNCYKIRLAITSKGKGKSGGARILTHIHVAGNQVYLLSIYDKSDQENISNKELDTLLKLIH